MHEPQVEGSAVPDFIVHIIQASRQQNLDTALDLGVLLPDTKLGQCRDGCGPDNGVLQDDAVVDVANVLGGLGSLGAFQTKQVENAHGKLRKLAVLDKFAEMGERILLRVGHELDEVEHALHHRPLELVAAFVAKDAAEEGQHAGLLAGELEAERSDSFDDGDLEFVGNLRHEGGDLLHQAVHASLVARLEKGRDGKGGDGPVAVRDEELDVGIAHVDSVGLERGKVVEDAERGELGNGAGRRQEELKNVDGLGDLGVRNVSHIADSLGCFEIDHLALMPQPTVEQLHHGLPQRRILFGQLCRQANQQHDRGRALDRARSSELLHHLDQGHLIMQPHLI